MGYPVLLFIEGTFKFRVYKPVGISCNFIVESISHGIDFGMHIVEELFDVMIFIFVICALFLSMAIRVVEF